MLFLYIKLISLIFCAVLGYIGGRYFSICQKSAAVLIVYLLAPVFNFYVMANSPLPYDDLVIIPISLFLCLAVGIPALWIGKKAFPDSRANLLSLTLSVPNAGYFGIPLVLVIFGESYLAHQLLISVGVGLSVYTYGFYIMNRSVFTIRTCLLKVFTLPVIYAIVAGMLFSHFGLKIPEVLTPTFELFKGAYSVLGLMMIGIGLGKAKGFAFDWKLISITMIGKFLVYPLLTALILFADAYTFYLLDDTARYLFVISALMPLGINTINFAALTNEKEAEAATLVVVSTVIACIFIPLIMMGMPVKP